MSKPDTDLEATEVVAVFRNIRRSQESKFESAGSGDGTLWGVLECSLNASDGMMFNSTFTGTFQRNDFSKNQTYRFFGAWEKYQPKNSKFPTYQFKFKSFCEEVPVDGEGIISFLARIGSSSCVGVTRRVCRRLVDVFGQTAIDVVAKKPTEAMRAFLGTNIKVNSDEFQKFSKAVEARGTMGITKAKLLKLLDGRGFPLKAVDQFVEKYGLKSESLILRNPHLLLTIPGFGISRVDKLYLDLGGKPEKPKRVALALAKYLDDDKSSSTWHYDREVINALADKLPRANVEKGLKIALRKGIVAAETTASAHGQISAGGQFRWLSTKGNADDERFIARELASNERDFLIHGHSFDVHCTLHGSRSVVSNHQILEVRKALSGRVGILCGGPGTGKTTTVGDLIAYVAKVQSIPIVIGSPTGMARMRIDLASTAALARHSVSRVDGRIGTWHALGAGGGASQIQPPSFGGRVPFVIGDESSMCDLSQFAAILRAFPRSQILFVGDPDQLPPVGAGRPFLDLIESGLVPVGRLTEFHRSKGAAVAAVHAIRSRRPWSFSDDFMLCEASSPEAIADAVDSQVLAKMMMGVDVVKDCQVLVAVNDGHAAAKKEINLRLREICNRNGEPIPGTDFRVGDKVVNRKNVNLEGWNSSDQIQRVYNGETGHILGDSGHGDLCVVFGDCEYRVPVESMKPRKPSENDDDTDNRRIRIELGYAISVHASQGSEWPHTILVLDPTGQASRICGREWFTVGISRHRDSCVCVGLERTAKHFADRTCVRKRKTFLKEIIAIENSAHSMQEI